MGTVAGAEAEGKRPGTGSPLPECLFEALGPWLEERGRFRKALGAVEERLGVASPDAVLRDYLEEVFVGSGQPLLTDVVVLGYRLTAAKMRAELWTLGTWAALTRKLGVQCPQVIPRSQETRLARALLNRLCARRQRWLDARDLPVTDPAARGLTRADLERVAKRAPEWAARIRDPRGPRPDSVFTERIAGVIRAIEARRGPKSAKLTWNHYRGTPTGLLAEVVTELLPWLPELAALTPHGRYKALLKARRRAQQLP